MNCYKSETIKPTERNTYLKTISESMYWKRKIEQGNRDNEAVSLYRICDQIVNELESDCNSQYYGESK